MDTKLPKNVELKELKDNWEEAQKAYRAPFKRVRLLDATDRGRMWQAISTKMPSYQILPDTNHVSFVKTNLLAAIYTVGKSAELAATTEEDKQVVTDLNIWLNHFWNRANVSYYQFLAGDRAALLNLGITQVGWKEKVSGAGLDFNTADGPVFKNVDPSKFMRDPHATSLETSSYCITWEDLHGEVLKKNKMYKNIDAVLKELEEKTAQTQAPIELITDRSKATDTQNKKGYYRLITHWIRKDDKIHEIHTIDNEKVIHVIENIKPSVFPFALCYCNIPAEDVIGTSEPAKIFANSFAYNFANSMLLTAEYKNQRPPRFLSSDSGINVRSFAAHGNDPDHTFITRTRASEAVHYHQFPLPSAQLPAAMGNLFNDIQRVTGIDERYTGNSTGSILTTGGMEAALGQATMIDAVKIANYEHYTRDLTKLVLANMLEFSPQRKYFIQNPQTMEYETIEIDFADIDKDTVFDYVIDISSELPRNKQRTAQMADKLIEAQMQYANSGQNVDLITPEEWLYMQDIPNKELMLNRMGLQRSADYIDKVTRILYTFSGLSSRGMDPQEAIALTAQSFASTENPNIPPPEELMMEGDMAPLPEEDPLLQEQVDNNMGIL